MAEEWPAGLPGGGPLAGEAGEEVVELTPAAVAVLREAGGIADRIADRLLRLREMLDSEPGLRERLFSLVRPGLGREAPPPGVAIDSTYPIDGGLDLVIGHLVVIVAGYVGFGGACGGSGPCSEAYARAALVDSEEARKQVPLRARLLERGLMRRILRGGERASPRIVVIDGEIVPYTLLFKPQREVERSRLLSRLDEATAAALREARERRVTIVGVVKRSYSSLLSALLGRELPVNDKALATLIMRPGHYMVAGRYSGLLPPYAGLVAARRGRNPEKYRRLVEERLARRPEYGEITVAFYRPSGSARAPAVRVEVLDYAGIGLERLLSILNAMTNPATGLPYPVDLVDEYTRIEARVLELLRRRVLARLALHLEQLGSGALLVAGHTNPEKRYIYEPRGR